MSAGDVTLTAELAEGVWAALCLSLETLETLAVGDSPDHRLARINARHARLMVPNVRPQEWVLPDPPPIDTVSPPE